MVFREKRVIVFNESASVDDCQHGFLTLKAPLYKDGEMIGLYGISMDLFDLSFAGLNYFFRLMGNFFDMKANSFIGKLDENRPHLTPRESQCLSYYLQGFSAQQIANQLTLSRRTIEFYISKIKTKLSAQRQQELITKAIKLYPELIA